jgi:hypothetical protein
MNKQKIKKLNLDLSTLSGSRVVSVKRALASLIVIDVGEEDCIWPLYGPWYCFDERKIRCTVESNGAEIDKWMNQLVGKLIEDIFFDERSIVLSVRFEDNITLTVSPSVNKGFEHWCVYVLNSLR